MESEVYESEDQGNDLIEGKDGVYLTEKQHEDKEFLYWAQSMYHREVDIQLEDRYERARDCAFYDGDQFTDEELEIYQGRDQAARCYNEIKPTIDWILGGERRSRVDWNILPRSEDDVEIALVKTKLVKYINDINKAKYYRTKAFEEMVKSGEGWVKVYLDKNDDGDPQISYRYVHWRDMVRDSTCRDTVNFSDCRYQWETRVVDLDALIVRFPEHKEALEYQARDFEDLKIEKESELNDFAGQKYDKNSGVFSRYVGSMSIGGGLYCTTRKAVRIWEMWYKKTERVKILRKAGGSNNEIYDENNPVHAYLVTRKGAQVIETVRDQMYMALYTEDVVLYHGKSIYAHNKFPYVCRTAFMKDADNSVYGVIRQVRDPQSSLNARRNRALFLMSSNQVVMEDGAVDDLNHLAEQVSKPNGIIVHKPNRKLEIGKTSELAAQQVQFAEQDAAYINRTVGVTSESLGAASTGKSGIAIQALQEQGSIITTSIIDNNLMALQVEGELILSLIEQFMDAEIQFRITGDDPNKPEFVRINDGMSTSITETQADFIVSERDYRQTMRQALSEQMLAVVGNIIQTTGDPKMAVALLEMSVDLQDLPNKKIITAELRRAAGLPPRDETEDERKAREGNEQAQQQQQAAIQQKQQEILMMQEEAKAKKMQAEATQQLAEAEREHANAIAHKMDAAKKAFEMALIVKNDPHTSQVADDIINNIDNIVPKPQDQQLNTVQQDNTLPPAMQE